MSAKIPHGNTFADRLAAGGGHPRGFDYLRLILATAVVALHSFATTHNVADDHVLWHGPMGAVLRMILPMFFALSGFLVAGSLARSASLLEFGALRVLRIAPALMAEIALSALVLGPILTEYPLRNYFSDRQFFSYFRNMIGDIHYTLPGMFLQNPRPHVVNGSLWTIPFEAICYLVLAALALSGVVRRRRIFLMGAVFAVLVLTVKLLRAGGVPYAPPGELLVCCFLAGIALFQYRDCLVYDARWFVGALIAALGLLYCDETLPLAVFPLAYVTAYIGVTRPRKTILLSGDYSYGIYLFAYPIQQAAVFLLPRLDSVGSFLLAFPLSFAYAVFSWHCIEKPILSRKRHIVAALTSMQRQIRAAFPA